MSRKNEIVSFNETVPELSTLLELDPTELDQVLGGLVSPTTCDTYKSGSCSELTCCGTFGKSASNAL